MHFRPAEDERLFPTSWVELFGSVHCVCSLVLGSLTKVMLLWPGVLAKEW